jgi:hypothetical protein
MILRTVFVKLDDTWSTDAGRAEVMAHTRRVFADIPGIAKLAVGPAADASSQAAWDFTIQVHFVDMDTLEHYRTHPVHLAYLNDYLSPKAVVKKVWNFDLD